MHLGAGISAEFLVDLVDNDGNVFKALAEEMEAFGLHLLKLLIALLGGDCAYIEC